MARGSRSPVPGTGAAPVDPAPNCEATEPLHSVCPGCRLGRNATIIVPRRGGTMIVALVAFRGEKICRKKINLVN